MSEKKNIIQIKIVDIKLNNFELKPLSSLNIDIEDESIKYKFENSITIDLEKENDSFNVIVNIKITPIAGEKDYPKVVDISIQSSYKLKELKKYVNDKEEINLPGTIFEKLVLTSISNTRGFMSAQLSNTDYKNVILPFVTMDDIKTLS